MDEILHQSPFPALQWDGYSWQGKLVLEAWAGFQARLGDYGASSPAEPSDGTVHLSVSSPDEEPGAPLPEQGVAYEYLLKNQEKVCDAVVQAIFDAYPDEQIAFGYEGEDAAQYMPDIEHPQELKALIGLSGVHILNVVKDGVAYIGFEFGCTWDDEHGLGVMTHNSRVVQVGGADTSFLEWIAQEDADAAG